MSSQALEIFLAVDSFTRLRIFADCVLLINIMFRVQITGRRSRPMLVQSCSDLLLSHGHWDPLRLFLDGTKNCASGELRTREQMGGFLAALFFLRLGGSTREPTACGVDPFF